MHLFERFEDPDQPLLGPSVYWLQFMGLILPKNKLLQFFYKFVHVSVLLFGVSEFIELWYVRSDLNELLNNLKITMTSIVTLSKVISFMVNQKAWCEVIDFCNRAEIKERTIADSCPKSKRIIEKYTAYCRRLTYSYWILVLITCAILIFQPIMRYILSKTYRDDVRNGVVPYDQIFSAWVPFDKNTPWGYAGCYFFNGFVAFYAGVLLISFDTSSIVFMVFFRGQIELLQYRSAMIFGANDSPVSDDIAMESLRACHEIHRNLHKYAKLLNSLLSPTMMLYVFVCSVMLCCSTYQFIITMTSVVSMGKIITFIINQKAWCEVIDYCNRDEIRKRTIADSYPVSKRIIQKYTSYCKRLTYSYWVLVFITCSILIFQPIMKYVLSQTYREDVKNGVVPYDQIFSAWVPFDKNTVLGYTFIYLYYSILAAFAGGLLMSFDTISIVFMVFFKGQMELLECRCLRIFGTNDSPVSDDIAMESLRACHEIYKDLHKYAKILNSLLSPTMMLYVIVCSVMLCCSTYQLIEEESTTQRFLIAEYLVFGVAQLFIYCWHSNEVLYKSQNLFRSPYESLWYTRKTTLSKELVLLTGQMSKTIIFTAGPFTDLNVATFISILKGAYSYYTLLSNRN